MSGGVPAHQMWMSPITENPKVGETQVWEFYNFTADAHPIHLHTVHFQVVDRQKLVLNDLGEVAIPVISEGLPRAPEPWEDRSFKDTVIAYPGEVTRVRAKFESPGLYVWHCHIVEHEDKEMMRPYFIGGDLIKLPYKIYSTKLGKPIF
jgi:spore coat protein A